MNPTGRPENREDRLIQRISELIAPLGYEVVHIEVQTHRKQILRLFIDFSEAKTDRAIGIEDCAKVSRRLDEPLENSPEIEAVFGQGGYELEVSSPGIDRPLRTEKDYERFSGKLVRVHVFRPLTADELENPGYQNKNPKQKNFVGTLQNQTAKDRIRLELNPEAGPAGIVSIPLALVSKANLEPVFDALTPARLREGKGMSHEKSRKRVER